MIIVESDIDRRNSKILKARICLVGDATNIHFIRWVEALKKQGVNIAVISYRKARMADVEFHDVSCSEMRGFVRYERYIRLLRGVKMLYRLRRTLGHICPDLVHVHYLVNTPLVLAFWGLRKLIVSPWGNDIIYDRGLEPWPVIFYKKMLLRQAKAITTTTRFLGRHVRRYVDADFTVVPFGVDTTKFAGFVKERRKKIVISFIKHLEEKYGARYLVSALPSVLLKYRNVKVKIVGAGSQEEYLRDLVDKLRLKAYVDFCGKINHEQVIETLRKSDIFVMPSVYESEIFGVAAVEASAMKIPVIASDLPGIREAVLDGKTGILVPPSNAEAIAQACLRLIRNPGLRKQMGENGREYVRKNFEWNDCVRRMLAVYERVL